jgi:hypothetical protein
MISSAFQRKYGGNLRPAKEINCGWRKEIVLCDVLTSKTGSCPFVTRENLELLSMRFGQLQKTSTDFRAENRLEADEGQTLVQDLPVNRVSNPRLRWAKRREIRCRRDE